MFYILCVIINLNVNNVEETVHCRFAWKRKKKRNCIGE